MPKKIIHASTWAISGQFTKLIIKFGMSILLARLLTPKEFGLMGMITVLSVLLTSLSEFGLFSSLIQKKEVSQRELSSVFWLTLILGFFVAILFFCCAPLIVSFYNEPALLKIVQILSITFLFNSLILTHNAILTKELNFKRLETFSTISLAISSIISLTLAYFNWGIWALVFQQLFNSIVNTFLIWYFEKWRPSFIICKNSIKNLMGFGSRVFISNILNTFFGSIDSIIIGKFFAASTLGLYSYAQNLINVSVGTFTAAIVKVLFPVMSGIQNDNEKLKKIYIKTNNLLTLFIVPIMGTLAILAKEIVVILLGSNWAPMVPYFQLFAIIGMLFPISALNINLILSKGRADKFLSLEIIKKGLLIVGIIAGFQFGTIGILYGILVISIIGVLFNLYYSGKIYGYNFKTQLKDLIPVALLSSVYLIVLFLSKSILIYIINEPIGAILSILISTLIYYLFILKFKKSIIDDILIILNGLKSKTSL